MTTWEECGEPESQSSSGTAHYSQGGAPWGCDVLMGKQLHNLELPQILPDLRFL